METQADSTASFGLFAELSLLRDELIRYLKQSLKSSLMLGPVSAWGVDTTDGEIALYHTTDTKAGMFTVPTSSQAWLDNAL